MDLSTRYLGFDLPHPLISGASPLAHELDSVRRLEDAGAAAVVMHSLFEEQLLGEQLDAQDARQLHAESFSEAMSYLPDPEGFVLGPDDYLELLASIKNSVSIPVIGSLNGTTLGGWVEHARLIEEAGADALELNLYAVATDVDVDAGRLEADTVELCNMVRKQVSIPVAVKLSPYYTSLPNLAGKLDAIGINGLVLFNRFYQPDIDVENLEVRHALELSSSAELLPRLRWLAILSGRLEASLAVTGGVHTAVDAVKAVMCGAHAVQMVSALLIHGPGHLAKVREELSAWLEEQGYESLAQMQGSMGLLRCPNPRAYERANYVQMLQSWWR
ncbi:MAG: dihydroorotate dehydrogenase-like protein [Myxococcales bacterium]|nr:MAG: dihydroorotate dehydrogenase-like protein [Myxococcales bacterium]